VVDGASFMHLITMKGVMIMGTNPWPVQRMTFASAVCKRSGYTNGTQRIKPVGILYDPALNR
jgi:hypothetical protein